MPEQQSILQEAQPDDSGNDPDGPDVDAAVDAATDKLLQDLDRGQGLEPADEQEDEAELELAAAEACLIDTALGPLDADLDDVAVLEEPWAAAPGLGSSRSAGRSAGGQHSRNLGSSPRAACWWRQAPRER